MSGRARLVVMSGGAADVYALSESAAKPSVENLNQVLAGPTFYQRRRARRTIV